MPLDFDKVPVNYKKNMARTLTKSNKTPINQSTKELLLYFCAVADQRYFIELCYDGTEFHGWQTQPNGITVQELLDKALTTYFRRAVSSLGCGRTDAGVHATQFFAHFDLAAVDDEFVKNSVANLNSLLPYSIAVKRIFSVPNHAHTRFDATARSYEYHLHFEKNPFKLNRSWFVRGMLDVAKMNAAAQLLLNYSDFSCFSKSKTQTFTNNCNVMQAGFEQLEDGLKFNIKADRFLRNMVRAIVGTLILIGKGDLEIDDLPRILESKNRSMAGQSVPACGLYLTRVEYPYVNNLATGVEHQVPNKNIIQNV